MLDMAIDMLGPDLEMVETQLQQLGVRHINYGVMPQHDPLMSKALLQTIENKLGSKFTDRDRDSWNAIYTFMSVSMMQGAFQELTKIRRDYLVLQSANEKRKEARAQKVKKESRGAQNMIRSEDSSTDFSERTASSSEASTSGYVVNKKAPGTEERTRPRSSPSRNNKQNNVRGENKWAMSLKRFAGVTVKA